MMFSESNKGEFKYGTLKGEACLKAKLTNNQVLEIRESFKGGTKKFLLAKQYGVATKKQLDV